MMAKPAGLPNRENFPKEPSLALEMMMDRYGTMVLRTAFFYLNDRYLAEDISQEVFLRAYRHWTKFRGESNVKTWLTRITVNACRDKLGLKMSTERPTDPVLLDLNRTRSVEEEALERLNKTEILQHILRLPLAYQEVLYLYYYLDLTTKEIAGAVEVPEGTVRGRLHRAREMLGQDMMKEERTNE